MLVPVGLEHRCMSEVSICILAVFTLVKTSFIVLTSLSMNPLDCGYKRDEEMC